MSSSTSPQPTPIAPSPLSARLLSVACYLGLAPVASFWRSRSSDPVFRHHFAQSMAAFFLLQLWFWASFLFEVGAMFILIRFPELDRRLDTLEFYLMCALLLILVLLMILWLVMIGLALAGSSRQIPWLKQLARRTGIIRFSFISNSLVLACIPLAVALAVYATSLTRTSREGAAVYFLYDEGVWVPRWAFALGMYRVTLQGQRNWGTGSTVVDRLNTETLRTAMRSGKVVILATHGEQGYAVTYYASEYLCVGPPDTGTMDERKSARFLRTKILDRHDKWSEWKNVSVGSQLRLAYIFACNSGTRASQWQEHLAPAQVVTYNRISTVLDHAYWFAFTGPATIKELQ